MKMDLYVGFQRMILQRRYLWHWMKERILRRRCVENARGYDWDSLANLTECYYGGSLDGKET